MSRWRRMAWTAGAAVVLLAIGMAGTALLGSRRDSEPPRWLTQAVDRGDVRRVVNASGTLNPVNLIQVGSQVSGTIASIDTDFNANVKAGQRLALIDPALLDAELEQARAQTRNAQANRDLARVKLQRQQGLHAQGWITAAELDDARTAVATAEATLAQQRAGERRARSNRAHAEIRSPVAGTVVSREVAVGQTVAASLQTPVLFRIAQDLRAMQIEVAVSEADVGLLREGQAVSFSVDAVPERAFEGRLAQIRNNYTLQQNVVTYTAVVTTRNDELLLRPGMTAYVSVVVAERSGVLRVPNAALRYEPAGTPVAAGPRRTVWTTGPDGQPRAVTLQLGVADARHTEVRGGIDAGTPVIVGEQAGDTGFGPPRIL